MSPNCIFHLWRAFTNFDFTYALPILLNPIPFMLLTASQIGQVSRITKVADMICVARVSQSFRELFGCRYPSTVSFRSSENINQR